MNKIYDNGELLLGTKKDILKYQQELIEKDMIEKEDYEEIIDFLKDFKDTDIVCINYNNGMGLSFDIWSSKDIIKDYSISEDRTAKYNINKNKVWKELFYKGVAMNSLCVFTGKTNKECQEWLKEHKA